jgi:hypothetical protein
LFSIQHFTNYFKNILIIYLKKFAVSNKCIIFVSTKINNKMKRYSQQKQVVAIYANSYSVLFTDKDPLKVKKFASENRSKLKKEGAIKVITNIGLYES